MDAIEASQAEAAAKCQESEEREAAKAREAEASNPNPNLNLNPNPNPNPNPNQGARSGGAHYARGRRGAAHLRAGLGRSPGAYSYELTHSTPLYTYSTPTPHLLHTYAMTYSVPT